MSTAARRGRVNQRGANRQVDFSECSEKHPLERYQLCLASQLVPLLTPGLKRAFPDTEEGANKKAKHTNRAKSGGKACATIILLEEILIMFSELAQQLVRQNSKGKQPRAIKR